MSDPERYAQLRATAKIRERPLLVQPRSFTELELQARWFAGDFGKVFTGTAGEKIEVVQFGTWNREAGPDFSDAAIRVDHGEILRGSIEFDLADQNWETHGHATNPAFDDTLLHVFVESGAPAFFTRTTAHRQVPQVRVDPATLPVAFSLNLPLARPGRCHAPLRGQPEEKICSILEAAARFRLQRKAQRLQRLNDLHGAEEALYQELAAALGYKQNKLPFTLLAQRLPLKMLRALPNETEAILFGVASFLATPDLAEFESGTRQYLRLLWERWWPRRAELERLILPPRTWRLSGTRPLNHPQRRLAALAGIVAGWPKLLPSLGKDGLAPARQFFLELQHPFWNFHYTLTSQTSPAEMALVGDTRITEILANVILPWRHLHERAVWPDFAQLPARLTNRRIETGVARLFGDDPRRPRFLRTVAQQQGLLQIYEDFCLQDDSDCAQCPFPEQMQKWT
ncbi:MAG TPA: DUF2851 family protein [Chthoniobacterales bacterium]|nr:DUF2851 family protein [Chthoniobacterales bacterium]